MFSDAGSTPAASTMRHKTHPFIGHIRLVNGFFIYGELYLF